MKDQIQYAVAFFGAVLDATVTPDKARAEHLLEQARIAYGANPDNYSLVEVPAKAPAQTDRHAQLERELGIAEDTGDTAAARLIRKELAIELLQAERSQLIESLAAYRDANREARAKLAAVTDERDALLAQRDALLRTAKAALKLWEDDPKTPFGGIADSLRQAINYAEK